MTQLTLTPRMATDPQMGFIRKLRLEKGEGPIDSAFTFAEASKEIDRLKALPAKAKVVGKQTVPLSNYALEVDGEIKFYRVAQWKGTTYLRQLIGHPGDWQKIKLSYPVANAIMARLAADPLAAAQAYGEHYTVCAVCNSPLSDPLSMERKIGPICWSRFGF